MLRKEHVVFPLNVTLGLTQTLWGSGKTWFPSRLQQHAKQCFDGDRLRNLITVGVSARGRNMPTQEESNFHHSSTEIAALIPASALPLAVFYILIFVCVCVLHMCSAHPRVLLSGNGCGTTCVCVRVGARGGGRGEGLAVPALMVA